MQDGMSRIKKYNYNDRFTIIDAKKIVEKTTCPAHIPQQGHTHTGRTQTKRDVHEKPVMNLRHAMITGRSMRIAEVKRCFATARLSVRRSVFLSMRPFSWAITHGKERVLPI
ncbi:hypothetical protein VOLCADRAFT_107301 [Volvox carteri f. nagariensis]|uniref:Uncharacterized protein n=1 Tax=Volvox carteri f. nagariensis TaxID=3068 RepID=D8UD40_VOLCA|nr:uncharacterized protein VOLCADRAFT_107301 [Volvox carteri f. nagariensis]EFJ42328.1 hypothetical protein VOLCADRAFT_107301 [Volvox carteri f. nagariensis]|eukprot:XP_002956561.1 hypothetical protein VOLCADRAFT_107301 [Volvox carteri f. nagariensis]